MSDEVAHIEATDDDRLSKKINEELSYRNSQGWKLVDTELSTSYNPETDVTIYDVLLIFEGGP